MPYVVPSFNLVCRIYTGPWITKVLRASNVPCNLAQGKRVVEGEALTSSTNTIARGLSANLLLPALTDIRDPSTIGGYDVVEVPQGSGRWYAVMDVDDVGKGFANEYRTAAIGKIYQNVSSGAYFGLWWPTPIP